MKTNAVELAPSDKAEPCLPGASPSCAEANGATNTEDATLAHRANREVFEALFLQYKDKIFSYQFSLVRDLEDARDLILFQEEEVMFIGQPRPTRDSR